MRSILSLAIGLFLVTVLWRADRLSSSSPSEDALVAKEELHVIAAAQGHLLPRGFLGAGPERLGSVLLVGALNLKRPGADPGLRVAVITRDGELVQHRNYNVAGVEADVQDFVGLPNLQPVGTLLLIASTGRIERIEEAGAESERRLQAAIEVLGARSRPFERTPVSWALITLRRPSGWVMLAEGFDQESGVAVAFTLAADRSIYDSERTGFRGDYLVHRGENPAVVRLYDEVLSSAYKTAKVRAQAGLDELPDVPSEIQMPLRTGPVLPEKRRSFIAWEDLWLGDRARFHCELGLRPAPKASSVRVVATLLVDDEVIDEREIGGDVASLGSLTGWDVDLAEHMGRLVKLELRMVPMESSGRGLGLWRLPTISYVPQQWEAD